MPYAGYGRHYAAGDYAYQAGGLFGSIGKLLRGAATTALSFIPGPGAAIARALIPSGGPARAQAPAPLPQPPGLLPQLPFGPGPGALPPLPLPGPQSGTQIVGPQVLRGQMMYSCTPDGTRRGRKNKSTYITRGGGTSRWPQTLMVHYKGTECVAPRRMNPLNPKAARRSIRRLRGAMKLSREIASSQGYTIISRAALKGGYTRKAKRR